MGATSPAAALAVDAGAYRRQLAVNLRRAGGAMLLASYAVPLGPHVGTLCPLRRLTGVPCPFCGLTTGVVDAAHGHLAAGLGANPVAPLLVAATVSGWMVWALRRFSRSRRVWSPPAWSPPAWSPPAWSPPPVVWTWARRAVAPLLLAMWLFELGRFGWL